MREQRWVDDFRLIYLVAAASLVLVACGDNIRDLRTLNAPEVDGVEMGAVYATDVSATFKAPAGETYTATLDGKDYVSGAPITTSGMHTLVVTATYKTQTASTTITFEIDKVGPNAPMVSGVADGEFYNVDPVATFISPTGEAYSATLDGAPYTSGTAISAEGEHTLVVTSTRTKNGLEASTTITFTVDKTAPTLLAALVRIDGVHYQLQFSEPLKPGAFGTGSGNPANYAITSDCTLAVGNPASVEADGTSPNTNLVLAEPGCVSAESVAVVVSNVTDRAGNPLGATTINAEFTGIGVHVSSDVTEGQEVNAPTGTVPGLGGSAKWALTDEGLEYAISVANLSGPATAAHIHRGAIGVNGGVAFNLFPSFKGDATLTTARGLIPLASLTRQDIESLLLGDLYLNVHTAANAGGEVRGQIIVDRTALFGAALTTAQETGTVTGAANAGGTAFFRMTPAGLAYEVTVSSLSGAITAAHIHAGTIGNSGSPVLDIMASFNGGTARGVWLPTDTSPLTPALMKDFLLGKLYVNVHTAANPAGEVRGQIMPSAGILRQAVFDGAQEVPPVVTTASAVGTFHVSEMGVLFEVTATGLSGPIVAAHFHRGAAGAAGAPVRTVDLATESSGNTIRGVWTPGDSEPLKADLLKALLNGEIYFNLHTTANPAGEIRGQILAITGDGLIANLTGEQENPNVTAPGKGNAVFRLDGLTLEYNITVDGLSGPITNAHIHSGAIGVNGGVAYGLLASFNGNTASGSVTLTPADRQLLLLGKLYVNIHTTANPAGEIRGQILLASGIGLAGHLSGPQARDASAGAGTIVATLTEAGLVQRVTVADLGGIFLQAHVQRGAIGITGVSLGQLVIVNGVADALTVLADLADITLIENSETYCNIITSTAPAGEIRGQLLRSTR